MATQVIDPHRCPYCRSDEIEGESVDTGDGEAAQTMYCLACHRKWVDGYRLTSRILDDGLRVGQDHLPRLGVRSVACEFEAEADLHRWTDGPPRQREHYATRRGTVRVHVDLQELARKLATRALISKGGAATSQSGAVRVTRRTYHDEPTS